MSGVNKSPDFEEPGALDPHAAAPEVSRFIHAGPDAAQLPSLEAMAADEATAEREQLTMLLPRVFLIRHGQSLFNAMHAAHSQLPKKGQTVLNFSDKSPPIAEGVLVGGVALVRDKPPMRDPRLIDAPLTPHGQQQAKNASKLVANLGIDLVLSTPLTRAIQTSILVFRPERNNIDWNIACQPSLIQPLTSTTAANSSNSSAAKSQGISNEIPIRVIPYHVEHLCASCDVGLPLSIVAARFASEPNMDFEAAKSLMSDCWWNGSSVGQNTAHLTIKRNVPLKKEPTAATSNNSNSSTPTSSGYSGFFASASSVLAAAAKAATGSRSNSNSQKSSLNNSPQPTPPASPGINGPASSSSSSTIQLKHPDTFPPIGINISREQSQSIEARTKQLLAYLLNLAVDHSKGKPHGHRAMHVALVGHCGYFARLSGVTLDNCQLVELDWVHVLNRQALKGFMTLPPGYTHADIADVKKQPKLIQHWLRELDGDNGRHAQRMTTGGKVYGISNLPISTNTADLIPNTADMK